MAAHDLDCATEYHLTHAEALLAGTLALMTGHAQAGDEDHRRLMTAKICANLSELTLHTGVSHQFRTMLRNLRVHWEAIQVAESGESAAWQVPCAEGTVH